MTFNMFAIKSAFVASSAAAASQALEGQTVSLSTIGTVGVIVFGGVWQLSKMLTSQNVQMESLRDHVYQFEQHATEALARIEGGMGKLPCQAPECPKHPNHTIKVT